MAKSDVLAADSLSDSYLLASQLVSDLHHRSPIDVPALLLELVDGSVGAVPRARYAAGTVGQRRRVTETVAATHSYPEILDEIEGRTQPNTPIAQVARRVVAGQVWPSTA